MGLKHFIILLLVMSSISFVGFADDKNKSEANTFVQCVQQRKRSVIYIKCTYYNKQMWFDLPGNIDCLNVSVWNLPTGEFIEEQVCDSTPFDVPYTEGTLIITCYNDECLYGEGTIELN